MNTLRISPKVNAALYLRNIKPAALVSKAQHIHDSMNSSSVFTATPPYSMADFQIAINKCRVAVKNSASKGNKARQAVIDSTRSLKTILSAMKAYVQAVANKPENILNAAAIILSAGMQIHKPHNKSSLPESVSKISAVYTYEAGKILTKWQRAKYARIFHVYASMNPDDESAWVCVGSNVGRQLMVENLISGKRYFFRIVVQGTRGLSAPSAIASCMVA